jgi:uncharacterized protein (TIGR00297 family)
VFQSILAALAISGIFAAVSYRLRILNLSGSIATTALGTIILGLGGWVWIIPMLAFFLSASLLSIARKWRSGEIEEAKGSRRDAVQVLANGGLAGAVVLAQSFTKGDLYPVYLGVLAAVNADTWSTEIGVMLGRKPRNVISGRLVPAGTSGGATLMGLFGAVLGAILIAVVGEMVATASLPVIAMAGIFGSVFDSLLGATVQEKRRCPVCRKDTEMPRHCDQRTERIDGVPGVNNDVVNLLCGAMGGLITLFA